MSLSFWQLSLLVSKLSPIGDAWQQLIDHGARASAHHSAEVRDPPVLASEGQSGAANSFKSHVFFDTLSDLQQWAAGFNQ